MDDHVHSNDPPPRSGQSGAPQTSEYGETHNGRASTFNLRDLLTIGFRHQRLGALSFLMIFSIASIVVLLRPAKYEATMSILVKRERVDPLVSPEASAQPAFFPGVTEEELNSEVELLKSRDLLTQVVVAQGLQQSNGRGIRIRISSLLWNQPMPAETERQIASAVQRIAQQLHVQTMRKSNVIRVSYASPDPALSAAVLKTLAERYLEKHVAVHRPPGALAFYDQEAERSGGQLALVQARLNQENRDEGVVSVQMALENAIRLIGELEQTEQSTLAQIAETSSRIGALQAQVSSTPDRTTTEIRRGSSGLLGQLYSTLVTHELKRIELLRIYQPTYPLVQDVDAQIAKLRSAIAAAEQSPLLEETTNRNPTYDYLVTELAKNRSELAGLRARAEATSENLSKYRQRARRLDEVGLAQQALVRTASQAEQNFLTYTRKREEARASDALDAHRILNVAIAEEATVPFEPSGPPQWMLLLVGAFVAGLISAALAGVADFLDQSFRTPEEVEAFLGSPVLAALPQSASKAGSQA